MKTIMLLIAGLMSANFVYSQENLLPEQKVNEWNTVKITYKITENSDNSLVSGTKIVYMDKLKNKRREEVTKETKIFDQIQKQQYVEISDGKAIYKIESGKDYVEVLTTINHPLMDLDIFYQPIDFQGEEEIAGKKCGVHVWGNDTGIEDCLWGSIKLKVKEGNNDRYRLEEATQIEENIALGDTLFEVPAELTLKSSEEVFEQEQKAWEEKKQAREEKEKSENESRSRQEEFGQKFSAAFPEVEFATAMMTGDKAKQEEMNNFIKNDASLTEQDKQELSAAIDENFKQYAHIAEAGKNEDGSIDPEKMLGALEAEKVKANDNLAKTTLKMISSAVEDFANTQGKYPKTMDALTKEKPPYIFKNYCDQTESGFTYKCEMSEQGYTFTAIPETVGQTGTKTFKITNGGVLSEE